MLNLTNEEKITKINSTSFAIKNFFEYLNIDIDTEEISKMIKTSNSRIELENIVEFFEQNNIELEKHIINRQEFLNIDNKFFPAIVTVYNEDVESYIFVSKINNKFLTVFDGEEKKKVSIDDFMEAYKVQFVCLKENAYSLKIKDFKDIFLNLNNPLMPVLFAEILLCTITSILQIGFITSLYRQLFDFNYINKIVIVSIFLFYLQYSLILQIRRTIKSITISNNNDTKDKDYILLSILCFSFLCFLNSMVVFMFNATLFFVYLTLFIVTVVITLSFKEKSFILNNKRFIFEKTYNKIKKNISNTQSTKTIRKITKAKYEDFLLSHFNYSSKNTSGIIIIETLVMIVLFLLVISTSSLSFFYALPLLIPAREILLSLHNSSKLKNVRENKKSEYSLNKKLVFNNELSIKNLHHEYFFKKPVLKNININVPFDKKVVIYGHSGCGKTTLANIICKNLKFKSGNITFDDVNIYDINLQTFSSKIFYVSEKPELYDATILENITMFEKISMKRVVNVCKKIGLHSKIQNMPYNYKTKVNTENVFLSEVDVKKIIIARAILKNPQFLIIDGLNDCFLPSDIDNINNVINECLEIKTVLIFSRNIPLNLSYDIAYNINNGVVNKKHLANNATEVVDEK